jgi:hypothetical protein
MPLQAVSGVITQVYKIKHETGGQHGPYTLQKIQIQDQTTGLTLRASIFDADEIPTSAIGQGFAATIGMNQKGQPAGLYADHYQSQTQGMIHGIKCSKGGSLYLNGQPWSAGGPKIAAQPQYQQPQPQPQRWMPPAPASYLPPQTQPAAPPIFVPQTGFPQLNSPQLEQKSPLAFLTGQSAAYVMCFEAALRVREQLQVQLEQGPGEPISTSDVKEIATTFYIEGNRKGVFNNVVGNVSEEFGEQP